MTLNSISINEFVKTVWDYEYFRWQNGSLNICIAVIKSLLKYLYVYIQMHMYVPMKRNLSILVTGIAWDTNRNRL